MNPMIVKGALLVAAVGVGCLMAIFDKKQAPKTPEKPQAPVEPELPEVPLPDPAKLTPPKKEEKPKDDEPTDPTT